MIFMLAHFQSNIEKKQENNQTSSTQPGDDKLECTFCSKWCFIDTYIWR